MGLLRLGDAVRKVERVKAILEMEDERIVREFSVAEAANEVESSQVYGFVHEIGPRFGLWSLRPDADA